MLSAEQAARVVFEAAVRSGHLAVLYTDNSTTYEPHNSGEGLKAKINAIDIKLSDLLRAARDHILQGEVMQQVGLYKQGRLEELELMKFFESALGENVILKFSKPEEPIFNVRVNIGKLQSISGGGSKVLWM